MGFGDFLGKSLVLSQNCGECEQLLPFNILQNLLLWEKSDSQFMAKNALGPSDFSIYIFFNHQYLITRVTFDSDFLHVDRHG